MSTPSQFGSPQPSSGGGGSSVLMIVLIVLGVLVLVCGGACAGCVYFVGKGASEAGKAIEEAVRMSGAYFTAESTVLSDPQVLEKLGEGLEATSEPKRDSTGPLKPSGETFQFDIKGSKGTAIVSAVATAPDPQSAFTVKTITVKLSDGTTIDVPPPSEQSDPFDMKIEEGGQKIEP
jgi:hypothetical protein